jgi:hypothetical protein
MDYLDTFHPNEQNVVDDSAALKDIKNLDKGYNEFFLKVVDENGRTRKKKVVSYNSGDIDSRIRNAVTGHYTPHLVGSVDEDFYFSVIDARGLSSKGRLVFYYDSPEQYEREYRVVLNENIKQKWNKKRDSRLKT